MSAASSRAPLRELATPQLARLWRHMKAALGVLTVYAAAAVAVMAPLSSPVLPAVLGHEIVTHASGIAEARNALAEGQFPIRVAPHQNDGTRYPMFQLYGNLPYTLAGLLCLLCRINPYQAWKAVVTTGLVVGAFFTYRAARRLTRQSFPAAAAGLVFLTAPYLLTDLKGRFDFTETTAFCLLPVVFWSLLRCFQAPRPTRVLVAAAAWSGLGLTHNITFFYASVLFGLFFVSHAAPTRAYLHRLAHLAAAAVLVVLLTAWYIAPQLALIPRFIPFAVLHPVYECSWLTPLGVLLSPSALPPRLLPDPDVGDHFHLQVGWPILVGVGLALYFRCGARTFGEPTRRVVTRLLLAFGLAFFLAWSPFDFWRFLPGLFQFVQFSYRLLMFVVLWGSLLCAFALAAAFKGKMGAAPLAACVLGLGVCAAPFQGPYTACNDWSVADVIAHPDMGGGGGNVIFRIRPDALSETGFVRRDVNLAEWEYGITDPLTNAVCYPGEGFVASPRAGDVLRLEGVVPPEDQGPVVLTVSLGGAPVASATLPPGPFQLEVPIADAQPGPRTRIALLTDRYVETPSPTFLHKRRMAIYLSRLTFAPRPDDPAAPMLLPAEVVKGAAVAGRPATYAVHPDQAALVQLPVLFYPGMHEVRVNGRPAPYRNLGGYVALEVGPGESTISARFVGLAWANRVSQVTLAAVVAAFACLGAVRLRRCLRRRRPGPSMAAPPLSAANRRAA